MTSEEKLVSGILAHWYAFALPPAGTHSRVAKVICAALADHRRDEERDRAREPKA